MAGSGSQRAAQITKEQVSALQKRLDSYESAVDDPRNVMRLVLQTKKHEFFNGWAEDLEAGIRYGVINDLRVDEINAYIRRKLESAGLQHAIPYAKECLPAKYKRHDRNPGEMEENLHDNSSLNTVECPGCKKLFLPSPEEWARFRAICPRCQGRVLLESFEHENERWINLIELVKEGFNLVLNKMRGGHFMKLIMAKRPGEADHDYQRRMEELDQMFIMLYAYALILHEVFDDRQGVPAATQQLLIAAAVIINIEEASSYYFIDVKGKMELTRKQTRKIVSGLIRGAFNSDGTINWMAVKDIKGRLHIALEPKNADEARRKGYYGQKCPECSCWRVHFKYYNDHREGEPEWQCYCYGCEGWFIPAEEQYYKDPDEVTIGTDGIVRDKAGNTVYRIPKTKALTQV